MIVEVTHLHQRDPGHLRPARAPADPATLVRLDEPSPEFARFLYTCVGRNHLWSSRLEWTEAQWRERVWRPGCEHWTSWLRGAPVGYVELSAAPVERGSEVTINCLGLLPRYIGRGLGGQLLTEGVRRAWTMHERTAHLPQVRRVRLRTTSLDGDHALPNYRSRGFEVERVLRRHADVVADRLVWSAG